MKHKILLMLVASGFVLGTNAQKKSKAVTAYAITATEKGNSRWTEVRLVDMKTGEEVKSVYQSSEEVEMLNARTGQPIKKKELAKSGAQGHEVVLFRSKSKEPLTEKQLEEIKLKGKLEEVEKIIISHPSIKKGSSTTITNTNTNVVTNVNSNVDYVVVRKSQSRVTSTSPFATQSAACAYDKKHERLYYTPMGINQLRYIDLKSETPKIFYFEDEPFGVLSGPGDIQNQITRMVIAGDGNGYALTNNANHLIRFTTNKKAEITDLGALSDASSNGKFSIHSGSGYGGDIIADKSGNLYLITANRSVFFIDIKSKVANYKGSIKGLPQGFTTNGAVVESGTKVIVTSSTATSGYYIFDLNTLEAEKVSTSESVFNASDLANANLVSGNKKDKEEKQVAQAPIAEEVVQEAKITDVEAGVAQDSKITVFPNPVTNNVLNLSFNDYAAGRYDVQVMDLNGKMIVKQPLTINSKSQVQEVKLPALIAKGNYLVKVISETGKILSVEKFIVQ